MRVMLTKNRDQVAAERRSAYLAAWPLEKQAEALFEAAAGRAEKLDAMTADFAAIRGARPYPEE